MADRPVVVDSSISLSKSPSIDIAPVSIQDPKDGLDLETKSLKDPKAGVTIQALSSSELRLGVGIDPTLPKGTIKNGSPLSATEDPRVYAKA